MLSSRYDSAAVWLYFIPLYIAGAIIFMLALFTLLARVRGASTRGRSCKGSQRSPAFEA